MSTLALVVGVGTLSLAPQAGAAGVSSASEAARTPAGPAASPATEAGALALARSSGEPVEVTALRTETQEVVANPSGTFTLTQHAGPVRARKDGKLVPVDATLGRVGDRIRPRATTLDIAFSAGGDKALATLSEQGRSLTLEWPDKLPAPVLDGNEATYPEVFPGVDLKMRAETETISQLLVVKTAEAARNPELKQLSLGLKEHGLTVQEDPGSGTVRAVNPAGQEVFSSATPRMWDSSTPAASPPGASGARRARAAAPAGPADTGSAEPGGKQADVGLDYSNGVLTLTPDQSVLNGHDTTYPVYIDPTFGGKRQAWTIAYKPAPGTSFWNGAGWSGKGTSEARIGHENSGGGTARSFFQMDSKGLAGVDVVSAQFTIVNIHSWSCTPYPVELWDTGTISPRTTWNQQPDWIRLVQTLSFAHGNDEHGCGDRGVDFNVTSMAKDAAKKKWATMTLGLRVPKEYEDRRDPYAWKKFNSNPKLIVEYNRAPNKPTGHGSNPHVPCQATPYPKIGNTDVQLYAKIADPDGGTLKARFLMWPTGSTAGSVFDRTVNVTSGSIAKVTVPKSTFKDGTSYSWQVAAQDGRSTTAMTPEPPCRFAVDKTRPSTPPTVSSQEFPNGDDGTHGAPARTTGTFTLDSNGAKDVVRYVYGLNQKNPTTKAGPAAPGGSAQVRLTPTHAGPHVLYVYSEDAAGNRSDTGAYLFYASGAGIKDKPGDLNGDGTPDLWAVDIDNKLRMYPGNGNDGNLGTPMTAAESGFDNTLITRRGDYTNDGYEDLVARHADGRLWVYANTGFGEIDTDNAQEFTQFVPELDPTKITQITSLGDITGDDYPDLLARVGDGLWFLAGHPKGYVEDAYPLAESGWGRRDLVAPGDLTGDGRPDLLVRDDTTGQVLLHHGAADAATGGTDPVSLVNGTTSVYGSGGWWRAKRPLLAAPGDANGDKLTDLWATTDEDTGTLLYYPAKGTVHDTPVLVGTGGWRTTIRAIT
ncbi:VCBS repeat-containing protein [Streptomyces sp. NPDC007100]|uniref:FG-GAP repeat domain-containing protein n=1 Tax=Streptomyces sp. NPDC007100 TaxID=3155602 RepID=UPI0033C8B975